MGWQKTFTLARRAKGCHLVTQEVVSQIEPGLQDVKVQFTLHGMLRWGLIIANIPLHHLVDWDAVLVYVCVALHLHQRSTQTGPTRTPSHDLRSQHTSAALTINENYDSGQSSRENAAVRTG